MEEVKQINLELWKQACQVRAMKPALDLTKYKDNLLDMLLITYQSEVEARGLEFDVEEAKPIISWVTSWLLSPTKKTGLLLQGSVGNGKTTIVKAIQKLIYLVYNGSTIRESKSLSYVSALELSVIAKNSPEKFEQLKKTELLAIDDVGTEPSVVKNYGNEISPFVEVIYYRYDKQLFTILTSNLNTKDLGDRYGDRVADRFNEMFNKKAFENKSFRK